MANKKMIIKKSFGFVVLFFSIFLSLYFTGCSAKYLPLKEENLLELQPLTLAYSKDSVTVYHEKGYEVASDIAILSPIGSLIAMGAVDAWEDSLENEIEDSDATYFSSLIIKKFADRINNEIQNWPIMLFENKPFESWHRYRSDFFKEKYGSLMLFFSNIYILTGRPLSFLTRVIIYSGEAECRYYRDFLHSSENLYCVEDYKADDFKILKQEIEIAAEALTEQITKSLKIKVGVMK